MPTRCEGVPDDILFPADSWASADEYWDKYRQLATRFIDNFKTFEPLAPPEVVAAGPKL